LGTHGLGQWFSTFEMCTSGTFFKPLSSFSLKSVHILLIFQKCNNTYTYPWLKTTGLGDTSVVIAVEGLFLGGTGTVIAVEG